MTTVAPENDTSPIVLLLYTTPLGQFCRHPEIAAALAQDKLATLIAPFLHIPDLLSNERRLLRDWELERPQPYAAARASAPKHSIEFATITSASFSGGAPSPAFAVILARNAR